MSVNGFEEVEKALQEVSELDTRQAVGEQLPSLLHSFP